MKSIDFRKTQEAQVDLVSGAGSAFKFIEECINKQDSILKVLRLLILQSLTVGIKEKAFHFFRKEILQTYGNEYYITLYNLQSLGLFVPDGKPSYPLIRKSLRTIMKEINLSEPDDISYVYSGYVFFYLPKRLTLSSTNLSI